VPRAKADSTFETAFQGGRTLTVSDRQAASKLCGKDIPPQVWDQMVSAIVTQRLWAKRPRANPTHGATVLALKEITSLARRLRHLLAEAEDELGGALMLLARAGMPSTALADARALLERLRAAAVLARATAPPMRQGRPSGAQEAQRALARALAIALRDMDVELTITHERGAPASPYLRLLDWALLLIAPPRRTKEGQQKGDLLKAARFGIRAAV
jgi:hypothetical protein